MTNRTARVLVVHEEDDAWIPVRERLESLAGEGYLRSFLVLTVSVGRGTGADPAVDLVEADQAGGTRRVTTTLLGYLAGLGAIEGVTVCALRCDSADSPTNAVESADLDAAMKHIAKLLVQFATGVHRRAIRLAVIGEGEQAPGSPFFAGDADANAVVLPRDVSMNRAVARPVLRDNGDTFVAHCATEICSVLGLWNAMDSGPLDNVKTQPKGMPGYSVHFVSSRVKGLLAPPLPVSDLVDDSGVLPLPRGFSPVDNLALVVERFAEHVYPANMKFSPLERPSESERMSFREYVPAYLREFWRTFIGVPALMRRGFEGELEAIGAEALDRLVGGAEGRVRPIIPGSGSDESPVITEELVEEIIRDIEYRDGRPVVGGVTTEQWEALIVGVLGIADGNDLSQSAREAVMPANILVRDKSYLAPDHESVGHTVRSIMPPARPGRAAVSPHDQVVPGIGDIALEGEAPAVEEPVEVTFTIQGDVDLQALREAVRRSGLSRPVAPDPPVGDADLQTADDAVEVDRADRTLIGYVTKRFDDEFNKAEDSTVESLQELRTLPSHFAAAGFGKVSWTVMVAIALSISAIIVSLATHGVFRELFSMDWLSRRNRDFLWVGFSSLVLVLGVAALLSTGRRTWQGRTVFIAAVCAGIIATEYVVFDAVRDKVLESGRGLVDASVAALIFVGTVGLMVLAISRNWKSTDPVRRRIGRLLALVLWVYATLAVTSYIAGPESFILGWTDGARHRFLVAAQFVGWVCLIASTSVIVSIRVRQQNMFGRYQAQFVWAQENLTHSIDARRHLRTAYTQWLILASVLSRMIWHPLGREATERTAFDGSLVGDEAILKFDLAEIQLSPEGRTALLAQLKQRFVRKGWLKVQFDISRNAYQTRRAFITGDPMEDHDPVGCASVPAVESLLDGSAQGDRFEFARFLHEGTVDSRLLAGATNENLEDVYSSLMLDPRMHTVGSAQNSFGTGFDFLADIVPEEPASLPPRLLTKLHVAGDEATVMTSHLWWPESEIIGAPSTTFVETHKGSALAAERLNDSVVLLAVLVDVSKGFPNANVSLVRDAVVPMSQSPVGRSDEPEGDDDDGDE